jgi:transposase-like protein
MSRWPDHEPDVLQTEIAAYKALERLRWPDGPVCPHCRNEGAYFITPENGVTRGTGRKRDGQRTMSPRRLWTCHACRQQFSVLIGTPMSGTHLPIAVWVKAIGLLVGHPTMPCRKLGAELGITPGSALHLRRAIREEFWAT